jgi:hypothetical protein
MDQAYEAVGLRDNGDVYAIEVLGQQTARGPRRRRSNRPEPECLL